MIIDGYHFLLKLNLNQIKSKKTSNIFEPKKFDNSGFLKYVNIL